MNAEHHAEAILRAAGSSLSNYTLNGTREAILAAVREAMGADTYRYFTDGMEAAAQICGSLAETTYDDADAFEAATGCEAAIMQVVRHQRKEQEAAPLPPAPGGKA